MPEAHHVSAVAPDQKRIGAWLQDARKRAGLSQQAAAVLLGVDKQTISDWETGRYRMTAESFLALVLLYRADILELLATKITTRVATGAVGKDRRAG